MNRLEKAIFYVLCWTYGEVKEVLGCLKKGMRVFIELDDENAVEEFPDLKITVNDFIDEYF